jgi:PPM family protein phosphatase
MYIYQWADTNVGKVRSHNEDSYIVIPELDLFLLADGMGGHAGGKEASSMAVSTIKEYILEKIKVNPTQDKLMLFKDALSAANMAIFKESSETPALNGMGTTFTGLWREGNHGHMVHVGDSRLYLFRDGVCDQLSVDHTWVNEQLRAGYITEEEAKVSKFKSVITRSVGFEPDIVADAITFPFIPGDAFLICSDGLSNYFAADELARLFTHNFYSRLPEILVETALARGGADNLTLIIGYVSADKDPESHKKPKL